MDDMDDIDKSDPPITPILENENKDVKSKDDTEVVSVISTSMKNWDLTSNKSLTSITSDLHLESFTSIPSLQSSVQPSLGSSLQLSIQSLETIKSENDSQIQDVPQDDGQSQKQETILREKKCLRMEYIIFGLVSCICPAIVIFIWYQGKGNEDKSVNLNLDQNAQDLSNYSCPFWHLNIVGDEYCDDETNIAQCGYDFKDCCKMQSDRTHCQDCFCYLPQQDQIKIEKKYKESCKKITVVR